MLPRDFAVFSLYLSLFLLSYYIHFAARVYQQVFHPLARAAQFVFQQAATYAARSLNHRREKTDRWRIYNTCAGVGIIFGFAELRLTWNPIISNVPRGKSLVNQRRINLI